MRWPSLLAVGDGWLLGVARANIPHTAGFAACLVAMSRAHRHGGNQSCTVLRRIDPNTGASCGAAEQDNGRGGLTYGMTSERAGPAPPRPPKGLV